jgi:SAM-dependent methyltransferase
MIFAGLRVEISEQKDRYLASKVANGRAVRTTRMSDNITVSNHSRLAKIRRILASIPSARSAWFLWLTLRDAWLDSSEYSQIELRQVFSRQDPWLYSTNELEMLRHHGEMAMLDRVIGTSRFSRVLELGCAEGIFTEFLVDRCDSLLAMDFDKVALERARNRLGADHRVHFELHDLRADPVAGDFDLICAVHVLEYIQSPFPLMKIREKIVAAMKPGGYLLLGCVSFNSPTDQSWWSRYLLRGGKQITEFFARHPKLSTVDSAIHPLATCNSIDLLLRKTQ